MYILSILLTFSSLSIDPVHTPYEVIKKVPYIVEKPVPYTVKVPVDKVMPTSLKFESRF